MRVLKEKIIKKGNKWQVTSEDGKKNLGTYDTEEDAKKRLQQVHFFKNKGKKVNEKFVLDDFIEFLKKKGISDPRELTAKDYEDNIKEFRGELEKGNGEKVTEDFGGELTYMRDKKLLDKFDHLYDEYESNINKSLGIILKGNDISRYGRAWKSAVIDIDDHKKIRVMLTYSLPNGIYNYIYIIWSAELIETKGPGNIYSLYFDSASTSKEFSEGSHSAYKDGSRERTDDDSLEEMIRKVKKMIRNNKKIRVNEAKAPFENPNFDKEKFGKYFDDENKLIPELTSEYFAAVSADKAEKFNAEKFEKRIPHEMRFKEYVVLPDGTLYWICQGFFDESDLKTFKDALATTNLTKAFVTSRDVSTNDYDMDEKYEVGATIDLDNNLIDYENYRAATADEEEEW